MCDVIIIDNFSMHHSPTVYVDSARSFKSMLPKGSDSTEKEDRLCLLKRRWLLPGLVL